MLLWNTTTSPAKGLNSTTATILTVYLPSAPYHTTEITRLIVPVCPWVHLRSGFPLTQRIINRYLVCLTIGTLPTGIQAPEIYITDSNTWEVFQEVSLLYFNLVCIICFLTVSSLCIIWDDVVDEQFLVEEIHERELIMAAQLEEEEEEKRELLRGSHS